MYLIRSSWTRFTWSFLKLPEISNKKCSFFLSYHRMSLLLWANLMIHKIAGKSIPWGSVNQKTTSDADVTCGLKEGILMAPTSWSHRCGAWQTLMKNTCGVFTKPHDLLLIPPFSHMSQQKVPSNLIEDTAGTAWVYICLVPSAQSEAGSLVQGSYTWPLT